MMPRHLSLAAPRPGPEGNRLLAALTRAEQALLAPETEPVEFRLGATLYAPGKPVGHILFPDSGLVSLMAELEDGGRIEVGLVGREGLVGLTALLGAPVAEFRAVVQVPGRGRRIACRALRSAADGSHNLRDLVRRYAAARLMHAGRTAACNASHELAYRAARWLLLVQDRVGPGFPMTQEFLASMVGARRPTVNAVLRQFQGAGLLRCTRGRIAIADRTGLEAAACPCYRAECAALKRLLPGGFGE
jgi:CRP-like cAMP-binding protein